MLHGVQRQAVRHPLPRTPPPKTAGERTPSRPETLGPVPAEDRGSRSRRVPRRRLAPPEAAAWETPGSQILGKPTVRSAAPTASPLATLFARTQLPFRSADPPIRPRRQCRTAQALRPAPRFQGGPACRCEARRTDCRARRMDGTRRATWSACGTMSSSGDPCSSPSRQGRAARLSLKSWPGARRPRRDSRLRAKCHRSGHRCRTW